MRKLYKIRLNYGETKIVREVATYSFERNFCEAQFFFLVNENNKIAPN